MNASSGGPGGVEWKRNPASFKRACGGFPSALTATKSAFCNYEEGKGIVDLPQGRSFQADENDVPVAAARDFKWDPWDISCT